MGNISKKKKKKKDSLAGGGGGPGIGTASGMAWRRCAMSTAKAACTRKSSRVAIVGGGLAGMVAADALASRGFEDLHVFDMGETFVFWFLSLSL